VVGPVNAAVIHKMTYSQPLGNTTNISDAWCSTSQSICGICDQPYTIDNVNLIKSSGGNPGFFAMSKRMCVSAASPCFNLTKRVTGPLPGDINYCQSPSFTFLTAASDQSCNQLRDYNKKITTSGVLTTTEFKTSKTSSHIIKLVNKDFFKTECSQRLSPNIDIRLQNNILHANNCVSGVGNADARTRHYLYNCNSYSVNLNPIADRGSVGTKCCSPKISGPFVSETSYKKALVEAQKSEKTENPKNVKEKIYDAPVHITLFPNIPDYTILNDNFLYNLTNRIDCECSGYSGQPLGCII